MHPRSRLRYQVTRERQRGATFTVPVRCPRGSISLELWCVPDWSPLLSGWAPRRQPWSRACVPLNTGQRSDFFPKRRIWRKCRPGISKAPRGARPPRPSPQSADSSVRRAEGWPEGPRQGDTVASSPARASGPGPCTCPKALARGLGSTWDPAPGLHQSRCCPRPVCLQPVSHSASCQLATPSRSGDMACVTAI